MCIIYERPCTYMKQFNVNVHIDASDIACLYIFCTTNSLKHRTVKNAMLNLFSGSLN